MEDAQARVIAANMGDVRVFPIYAPNGQAVGSPAYELQIEVVSPPHELPAGKRRDLAPHRSSAAISMSRLTMTMCTIPRSGVARSCARTASAPLSRACAHRADGHASDSSSRAGDFQLVGLSDARLSEEPRSADRCDPRRARMLAARAPTPGRARDAQRQGAVRSRAGLGGVFFLTLPSCSPRNPKCK